MKCKALKDDLKYVESRPARGAWVEIAIVTNTIPPASSRPARGAWVEIKVTVKINNQNKVAPRKGRVG